MYMYVYLCVCVGVCMCVCMCVCVCIYIYTAIGAIPSPFDSYMVLRGMKTLDIRMKRHCENAMAVAQFLESHDKVERVVYPGVCVCVCVCMCVCVCVCVCVYVSLQY